MPANNSTATFSNLEIPTGAPTGTVIGTVTVSDPDRLIGGGATLSGTINGIDVNSFLKLTLLFNRSSFESVYELRTTDVLDEETFTQLDLQVVVTDRSQNQDAHPFALELTDPNPENTAPTDLALSNTSVDENIAVGITVGTLTASDANGDALSFNLAEDSAFFEIVGNGLRVKAALDYEQAASHIVSVKVTDANGGEASTDFTIDIGDVDDPNTPPAGIALSQKTIAENASRGTTVGIVSASDADGDTLTYKLADASGKFKLVTDNGNANTLKDASGIDTISGLAGKDTLYGYGGADNLHGGKGIDSLYGGAGADTFFFADGDTGKSRSSADTIFDFKGQAGDILDLSAVDANTRKHGNQAFEYIGNDDFGKHAGELRFTRENSDTWIEGDTDGNGKADFIIHFDDAMNIKSDNFYL